MQMAFFAIPSRGDNGLQESLNCMPHSLLGAFTIVERSTVRNAPTNQLKWSKHTGPLAWHVL